MFMARPTLGNDFRRGSLPGQTQQLPSFSHFLSGVQQSENVVQHPRPHSFSHQDTHNTFRRDLFNPRNDFPRPPIKPEISTQSSQHVEQYQKGRRTLLPQGSYSPTRAGHQITSPLPGPHTYRPHYEVQPLNEPVAITSPQNDSGHTKTVVREANIEGKGLCYIYNDGSACPKAINGDFVNPKWGTTKAGKPRKRLGQACNTCREKKIRCDPQLPKCTQCQKFGRECKFETGSVRLPHSLATRLTHNSSRGSHKESSSSARASPTTPELSKDTAHDRHGSSASAETASEQLYSRENSRSSINVESLLSPSSTVISEEAPPSKRRRVSTSPKNDFLPAESLRRPSTPDQLTKKDVQRLRQPHFFMDANPLDVDKCLTLRYVHLYMEHVNSKLYHIFPTPKFLQWIENGRGKSRSDLGVLYSIMAFGTKYSRSDDPEREVHGRLFTNIAEDVLKQQQTSPDFLYLLGQLVLSFQALSEGDVQKSKYLTAITVQICHEMGLHIEDGLDRFISQGLPCFGLDNEAAKECMRRVFWLAYVGNCFQNYRCDASHDDYTLNCKLRLPCDDSAYDRGLIPALPTFQSSTPNKQDFNPMPGHGMIAFLVEIASILEDVIQFQHSSALNYRQTYESFYQRMKARLFSWDKTIRKHLLGLQRTKTTAGYAEEHSSTGTSGLHIFYHFVAMTLHRHVDWHQLSPDKIEHCVKESHHQAVRTLELVHRLDEDGELNMPFARMARACPIASLAVFAVTDVITAAGAISDVLEHQHEGREHGFKEMVVHAIEALEDLSRYWQTAERQLKLVQERLKPILTLSQTSTKKAFFFGKPLYSPFGLNHDVVYGPSRMDYFRALGLGDRVRGESDMMEMGAQSPKQDDLTPGFNDRS